MQISLKQLVYFIAVAESGSISKALTSLNVTQSVVTEAIKKLEDTLGAELFTRHARGMILTHAGHQFLRHAHEVLAALRNAEQAIRERPITIFGRKRGKPYGKNPHNTGQDADWWRVCGRGEHPAGNPQPRHRRGAFEAAGGLGGAG
ncbi:LysR family transcriptional regulator [Meiothermus taiwanensis]|uniref:LysR family transcriptional regulator n=1 Tax=Meiothermus taiwanensis TaxID=172827 RepID=UPI00040645F1|nr:LysR family transcriptional regulator [Meiothermus taiwanensis]